MAGTVQRVLKITSDTSGLAKGAADVAAFGRAANGASEALKAAKASMDPAAYREYAAAMRPAIEAEKQVAAAGRAVANDLKPLAAEMRRVQVEALKASEAMQKRTLSEARAAEALRRTYDTGYANAAKYLQVEAQVARQIENRNLTVEQGNTILASAGKRFGQMGKDAQAANENVKLTSGQVQGIGYQLNDMATMLAMGASPFQILSSQAGQVAQVLQEGGGIKASIGAIAGAVGGFARSLGPVGLALTAATAAAGAMWWMSSGPESKEAKNSVDDFKRRIDSLRDSFGEAAAAADAVFARQGGLTSNMALGGLDDDLRKANEELKEARELLSGAGAVTASEGLFGSASDVLELFNREVRNAKGELQDLYGQFVRGEIDARAFVEQVAKIQVPANASERTKELAAEMRRLGQDVANAATNAEALQAAIDAVNNSRSRLPVPSKQDRPDRAGIEQRFGERIDPEAMETLREGLERQKEAIEKAGTQVDKYEDKLADMRASLGESVDSFKLQVDLFGQSEGAIASARFEADAMADAMRNAADAGKSQIDPALVDFIKTQAAEYGALTEKLADLREVEQQRRRDEQEKKQHQERVAQFSADLDFERSIIGLPEAEQDIRQTLHNLGVDYESFEGQRLAAGMRTNDQIRDMQDEMKKAGDIGKDAFMGIFDALTQGGDILDNVMDSLATMSGPAGTADKFLKGASQ